MILKPINCQSYFFVSNNLWVFAFNAGVIQLFDIIIKINTNSASNFIMQYSYKSKQIIGTWFQVFVFIIIFEIKLKAFFY